MTLFGVGGKGGGAGGDNIDCDKENCAFVILLSTSPAIGVGLLLLKRSSVIESWVL